MEKNVGKMVVKIELENAALDKFEQFNKKCEEINNQLKKLIDDVQKINRQMGYDLEVEQECVVVREKL